ncbi:MAG: recombinase family protein, partial [Chrysiogenetes bacterium]|nr:recombinase family protein [Chrysiogenetes bacterium]
MQASTKAFGFARVSSEDQARGGISLGLQMDAIRAYCAAKGLDLVKTWEVAETASFDDERVRFKEMLEEYSSSEEVPHLVFYKVDRSNRNTWDHARLEDLVRKRAKHLHAALDHFHLHREAPPSEWDRFEMMGLFARSETRHLSARVKSCIAQQTAQGHWSYKAPPGYRKIPRGGIEPDPLQGPLVAELLAMAATGNFSLDVLTKESLRLGIRYQGKALSRSAIHRWLVDPVFAGPFYSKGTLITNYRHTPLIDWRTHERIRERLSDYRRVEKKVREPQALSGVLECAVCGNSITFFSAKKGRYTYGFCGTCKRNGVKHPFLDEREAAAQLRGIAAQAILAPEASKLLEAGLYEYRTRKTEALQARRASIEARLEALRQKLSRAFEALTEGAVDGETYARNTNAWRSEKEK